jgi:hypothetical protein
MTLCGVTVPTGRTPCWAAPDVSICESRTTPNQISKKFQPDGKAYGSHPAYRIIAK